MRLRHRAWGDAFLQENSTWIKNRDNIDDPDFEMFLKRNPLYLEIGVGRGDFILTMAKNHPEASFLGVEMSGMALAIAGKKILEEEITNLLLVNMDAHYLFEKMRESGFDGIYLNFSDPWPKKRQHKRRLTYPTCLEAYYRILKPGGTVIFKTDNAVLFEDSLGYFEQSDFVVESVDRNYRIVSDDAMTEYERKFRELGTPIKRIVARKEPR